MFKIETNRLILRDYVPADWQAVHRYGRREDILVYEPWGPNSETDTQAFIARAMAGSEKKPRKLFELAVILKRNGELIGGCGFEINKENPMRGTLGYIINPVYWRNGFASEAANGLISFMVRHHGILEIEGICDARNLASQRVMEKCEMLKIKEVKEDVRIKGSYRRLYIYEKKIQTVSDQ